MAVSLTLEQALGERPIETTWTFTKGGVEVVVRQDGEVVQTRTEPWPDQRWLVPGQAQRWVRLKLAEGAEEFYMTTLEPLLGLDLVTTHWRRLTVGELLVAGHELVTTSRWEVRQKRAPNVRATMHLDAEGNVVRYSYPFLGKETTQRLTTRARATHIEPDELAEVITQSVVLADRRMKDPGRLRRAVYRLTSDGGRIPALPRTASQWVEMVDGGVRVEVDPNRERPAEAAIDSAEYLRSSPWVRHTDPEIVRLLSEVPQADVNGSRSVSDRTERLRWFVHDLVQETDLDPAFASASEVARDRAGDCTEHAVLLAALLRADGIPARTATGLLYVQGEAGPGFFLYHMWTQAWVDGRWTDLDAMSPGSFMATHIAFKVDSLDDFQASVNTTAGFLVELGRLQAEILEEEY